MADFDLNIKHPLLERYEDLILDSINFFEGNVSQYLKPTPYEEPSSLERRRRQLAYNNIYRAIINARVGLLTMSAPEIHVDQHLSNIVDDISGNLESITPFLRRCIIQAEVDGICWVVVDAPNTEGKLLTFHTEKSLNIRPYAQVLSSGQVINWAVNDQDKELEWIVVKSEREEEAIGKKRTFKDFWTLFERDRISTWIKSDRGEFVIESESKNNIGIIPMVPFYGVRSSKKFFGLPFGTPLISSLKRILNLESQIDHSLDIMTMPRLYMMMDEYSASTMSSQTRADGSPAIEPPRPDKAFIMLHGRDGVKPTIGYVEPTGVGVQKATERVSELVNRIYKTAMHLQYKDTSQVQSADSMREESSIFRADLASSALNHEASANDLLRVFSLFFTRGSNNNFFVFNKEFSQI